MIEATIAYINFFHFIYSLIIIETFSNNTSSRQVWVASAVSYSHNHLSFPNTSSSILSTPMASSHVTPATSARVTPVTSSHATPSLSPVHGQYTVTPNTAHPSPDTLPSHGKYTVTKNPHYQPSNSGSALFLGQNLPQASVSHSYSHLQARTLPEATSETVLASNVQTPTQHISSRLSQHERTSQHIERTLL